MCPLEGTPNSPNQHVTELIPQVPLQHLTGRIARQNIGKDHLVRHLPFGDLVCENLQNVRLARALTFGQT